MLKHRIIPVVLTLLMGILSTACTQVEVTSTEPVKQPVEVAEVHIETHSLKQMYSGRISADSTESISFMSAGKIAELTVKPGESVRKGQLLARLDNQAQSSGVSSSAAGIKAAEEVADKARLSLEHLEKTLADLQVLYDQGAISRAELEGAELQVSVTKADLRAAEAQVQAAKAGYSLSSSYLNDTKLYAPRNGVVFDVFYEKGDLVSAGYPVLMLEGQTMTAVFGLSAETLMENNFDREVEVSYDGQTFNAAISNIGKLPDPMTQTYEVEVLLPAGNYLIGSTVDIYVRRGEVLAVKLPIDIVLSGENDFVYVVEEGKAIKKNVVILAVQNNELFVEGLEEGDKVIVKGMKLVNPLDDVEIVSVTR